jgi:hypothetical protein
MKKLIPISIVLCVAAGCGVTNSKKFNPNLNGLYYFQYHRDVPPPGDSTCGLGTCYVEGYTDYIYVDYPFFHACHENFNLYKGKEDIKVAHLQGNYYKLKEVNGTIATKNIKYKMVRDTTSGLGIYKIKNGMKHYGVPFNYISKQPTKDYQKCINNAPDTTGIFPSWLKFGVQQNQ